MSILLEVCIDSVASALAAKQGGADRLEVCSALAIGGTTPSFGLIELCVADLKMPSMMMIRPHDGGFVYDLDDIDTMFTDIEVAKSLGVHGVVFGVLTAERTVDVETCQKLVEAADGMEVTFHRAFDLVADPFAALDAIEELGIHRILTSGQKTTAVEGASLLGELVDRASKVSILAGSGVNATNAKSLVERTGVTEIHASASVSADEQQSNGDVSFGTHRRLTCADKVRELKQSVAS